MSSVETYTTMYTEYPSPRSLPPSIVIPDDNVCVHDLTYTGDITFDFEPNDEVARPVTKCKKCGMESNGFIEKS